MCTSDGVATMSKPRTPVATVVPISQDRLRPQIGEEDIRTRAKPYDARAQLPAPISVMSGPAM